MDISLADLKDGSVVFDTDGYAYQKHDGDWYIANNWEGVMDPAMIGPDYAVLVANL